MTEIKSIHAVEIQKNHNRYIFGGNHKISPKQKNNWNENMMRKRVFGRSVFGEPESVELKQIESNRLCHVMFYVFHAFVSVWGSHVFQSDQPERIIDQAKERQREIIKISKMWSVHSLHEKWNVGESVKPGTLGSLESIGKSVWLGNYPHYVFAAD